MVAVLGWPVTTPLQSLLFHPFFGRLVFLMSKKVVLTSPDGKREWSPEDKTQEVNLRAAGWRDKPAEKQKEAPSNKSATPSNKSK